MKFEKDPGAPYTTTTKKTLQTKISSRQTKATTTRATATVTATVSDPSSTATAVADSNKGCSGKDNKNDVVFAGGAGALAMAAVAFTRDKQSPTNSKRKKDGK